MASSSVNLRSYTRLVRGNRNFRRLWLAQIVSENGDWFYTLAIYSLLLDLTGKASSVAMALVLQVLPHTLLGPLAGMVNDRFSRRKVMIVSDLLRMVIVACMLLVRTRGSVWVIYPLLLLETVMVAFFEPARSAVIPNVVTEHDVIVANTLSSATWSFDLAIGSVLGGAVAAWLGRDAVFVLNSLSFLGSAALIGGMRFVESHADAATRHPEDQGTGWSSIRAGVRYVMHDRKLAALVSLKGGVSIAGTSWVLFPVMAERVFRVPINGLSPSRAGLIGMSLLMGARGLGALVGPLFATRWTGQREGSLRLAVLFGFMLGGVGYLLLSHATDIWWAFAVIILAHSGTSTVWVFSTTLLHLNTEDRFRGRIFGADLAISMLILAVATWTAGQAIDFGVPPRAIAFGTGMAMVLPSAFWAMALRWWRPKSGNHGAIAT
ncbi:MAG TPA: MFS transporter [Candidatus Eisenbacteria bacterium]|nr:MFS transporter [Candidatus Eisenbacteria bacterium]